MTANKTVENVANGLVGEKRENVVSTIKSIGPPRAIYLSTTVYEYCQPTIFVIMGARKNVRVPTTRTYVNRRRYDKGRDTAFCPFSCPGLNTELFLLTGTHLLNTTGLGLRTMGKRGAGVLCLPMHHPGAFPRGLGDKADLC